MQNSIISFFDTRVNDNLIESLAESLNFNLYIYAASTKEEYKYYEINSIKFLIIPEIPKINESVGIPHLETVDRFAKYKSTILKVILRFHPNKSRIYKNQLYYLEGLYYSYLYYVENIIKQNAITSVIFGEPPHLPLEYIFHLLVKEGELKGIYFHYVNQLSLLKNYYFISNSFTNLTRDQSNYMDQLRQLNIESLIGNLNEPYSNIYNKITRTKLLYKANDRFDIHKIKNYLQLVKNSKNILLDLISFFSRKTNKLLSMATNRFILANNKFITDTSISNYDYVYFPLHFQPEASTLPHGNDFDLQLLAIKALIDIVSDKTKILVKEHPAYYLYTKGESIKDYRNESFYSFLKTNDRIVLVNHNEDSLELIAKSKCVITITGSVAFEALLNGKPCFIFGDSIYSNLPNVRSWKTQLSEINEYSSDYSSEYEKEMLVYLNMLQYYSKNYSLPRSFHNKKSLIDTSPNYDILMKELIEYVNYFL